MGEHNYNCVQTNPIWSTCDWFVTCLLISPVFLHAAFCLHVGKLVFTTLNICSLSMSTEFQSFDVNCWADYLNQYILWQLIEEIYQHRLNVLQGGLKEWEEYMFQPFKKNSHILIPF